MRLSYWTALESGVLEDFCKVEYREAWYELDGRTRPGVVGYSRQLLLKHDWPDWWNRGEDVADEVWLTKSEGPLEVLRRYKPSKHGSLLRYLQHRAWTIIMNMLRWEWLRRRSEGEVARRSDQVAGSSESAIVALGMEILDGLSPALVEVGLNYLLGKGDLSGLPPGTVRKRVFKLKMSIDSSLKEEKDG